MNKTKLQGHIIIFCASVLFGLNLVISKAIFPDSISAEGLTLARALFACIAFWITSLFVPREKISKKEMGLLVFCGITGIALNQGSFLKGLSLTSSVEASVLATCTPMFVIVLALVFLKEPITWKKASGVVIGAAGALLLVLSGANENTGGGSMQGNLLVLLSGVSYAVYLVVVKPLTLKYHPVTIMKWMFLFSLPLLIPLDWNYFVQAPAFIYPYHPAALCGIAFILFFGTYCTFMMIPMALKRIRPTTISMYNYVQPMVVAVAAAISGTDHLTWKKGISAILVFLGVYLVTISKSRAQVVEEEERKRKEKEQLS